MSNDQQLLTLVSQELTDLKDQQIEAVLNLLEEGNTVPFIARYRKEATGSLDEVQIKNIEDSYQRIQNLEKRKDEVLSSIADQEKLTDELEQAIRQAKKLQEVEDLYLPYKQKRRTKATIAREKGLDALAADILSFPQVEDLTELAQAYVDEEKEVNHSQDALDGAHEIIAEETGDSAAFRARTRQITQHVGVLTSKLKDEEKDDKGIYQMYYDFQERLSQVQSHRILALNRGEKEGILTVSIQLNDEQVTEYLVNKSIPKEAFGPAVSFVEQAVIDGYKRFIKPAIEREIRKQLTQAAEEQAIKVFGENLTHLLLQAPLKDQVILGLDPAFRTGCKLAVIDSTGKLMDVGVIFPHPPASKSQRQAAGPQLLDWIEKYKVDTIAIGNGTASRESEAFVAEQLQQIDRPVAYVIVNEAGASVYSASEEARREFPDLQVEERSAVSIARRLQDPLAELVKIDPQSLGVGQYQHDVSQKELTDTLDFVIETSVNKVGVNVNTASQALLQHISGLNKTTAQNFIDYRNEHGVFTDRQQFKEVPRVGAKTYEQAVGFLRIPNGQNPLDNTAIHPESYAETAQIIEWADLQIEDLGTEQAKEKIQALDKKRLQEQSDLGAETLADIVSALAQPGRDYRDESPGPLLKTDVLTLEDLEKGMEMEGTVRNVVDFGAFVDIGVEEDGLVHISKLSHQFVNHPSDVVAVGDIVTVWIDDIDLDRHRISLTMLPQKS